MHSDVDDGLPGCLTAVEEQLSLGKRRGNREAFKKVL